MRRVTQQALAFLQKLGFFHKAPSSTPEPIVETPVEVVNRSTPDTFRDRLVQQYLAQKDIVGLPEDPQELKGMEAWLEERGYKPTTISTVLSHVRVLYRGRSPLDMQRILPGPKRSREPLKDRLSADEMAAFLDYVGKKCSLRDRVIIFLMVCLKYTNSEISHLDVGDFNHEGNEWRLRIQEKGQSVKNRSLRVIPPLLDLMHEYHETVLKGREIGEPMFLGKKKARLRPDVISRIVSGIMKESGLITSENAHRITPYCLLYEVTEKTNPDSCPETRVRW